MVRSSLLKSACAAMAFLCAASQEAGAIEMIQAAKPAAHLNDDLLNRVVVVHGGAYRGPRGGVYRHGGVYGAHPGYRGGYGYHRGYGYHGGVYRGGWARPGWYHWPSGGAIAAGAALGVLAAGAAAAYAGRPPGPGLCWYYTDPGYRQGFWDAC